MKAHGWMAVPVGLLGFLLIGQAVRPGFTDYWGYLVVQTTAALVLLALAEAWLVDDGGLSWAARMLACTSLSADVFGNAARWYARSDEYDQLAHLIAIAAITTVLADLLSGLQRRGKFGWSTATRLTLAAAGGIALGIGWEGYEFVGDVVLQTGRSQGRVDTSLDIVCDTLGALLAVALVSRRMDARPGPLSVNDTKWISPVVGDEVDGRGAWDERLPHPLGIDARLDTGQLVAED